MRSAIPPFAAIQSSFRYESRDEPGTQTPDETLRRGAGSCRDFALLMMDLNGFKQVNDFHGHAVGDLVLQVVAARLRAGVRAGDFAARLGGDEFVFVAGGIARRSDAEAVARRLETAIGEPIDVGDGLIVRVGATIGHAATNYYDIRVEKVHDTCQRETEQLPRLAYHRQCDLIIALRSTKQLLDCQIVERPFK